MKDLLGSPGKVSGLVLRIGQCLFAAAAIGVMASASGFSTATAFCGPLYLFCGTCSYYHTFLSFSYLIASMGLQFLWSFVLACLDIHALRLKKDLHSHVLVSLFVVGDWVTAILSLAAACSSAGVIILFTKDTEFCYEEKQLECSMFKISVALAFISWFFIATSSYITFWLLASI